LCLRWSRVFRATNTNINEESEENLVT